MAKIRSCILHVLSLDSRRIRVEWNDFPLQRIKHQLIEKCVVGPYESLNVLLSDREIAKIEKHGYLLQNLLE
jgi:hypothetical protein